MRVIGTLIFALAVHVNYIVCPSINEINPLAMPGHPLFRTFIVAASEIPEVYVKIQGEGLPVPVTGELLVIAKSNIMAMWIDMATGQRIVRPLLNCEGRAVTVNTRNRRPVLMTSNIFKQIQPLLANPSGYTVCFPIIELNAQIVEGYPDFRTFTVLTSQIPSVHIRMVEGAGDPEAVTEIYDELRVVASGTKMGMWMDGTLARPLLDCTGQSIMINTEDGQPAVMSTADLWHFGTLILNLSEPEVCYPISEIHPIIVEGHPSFRTFTVIKSQIPSVHIREGGEGFPRPVTEVNRLLRVVATGSIMGMWMDGNIARPLLHSNGNALMVNTQNREPAMMTSYHISQFRSLLQNPRGGV